MLEGLEIGIKKQSDVTVIVKNGQLGRKKEDWRVFEWCWEGGQGEAAANP